MSEPNIRLECLRPAEKWERPTGEEIREVLRLAGLTGGGAAKRSALGKRETERCGVGLVRKRTFLMPRGHCFVTWRVRARFGKRVERQEGNAWNCDFSR